jgi:acetyl-CoA C-acetyltransferase
MDIVIAAGVESMTRVPMGLPSTLPRKNNFGYYMGPRIQDRYPGIDFSQFMGAEMMAKKYGFSREDLDNFSLESHRRAASATKNGVFNEEILSLESRIFDLKTGIESRPGDQLSTDEGIRFDASLDNLLKLKPLQEGGVITPGNASQICDGASGVMIVNEKTLKQFNLEPLARIHHMSVLGHDPVIMLEAPIPATERALLKCGMKISDIDMFEINEAFASVPLAWAKYHQVDHQKMNPFGGAIALGHPLGASGTKLMSTLVHGLMHQKKRWGLQSMCEGGGMANVTIIENMKL